MKYISSEPADEGSSPFTKKIKKEPDETSLASAGDITVNGELLMESQLEDEPEGNSSFHNEASNLDLPVFPQPERTVVPMLEERTSLTQETPFSQQTTLTEKEALLSDDYGG